MQNLDQIRAQLALAKADQTSKQAASKLPAMIMANGLLAATAFANEEKETNIPKRKEMNAAMNAAAEHLAQPVHGISILQNKTKAKEMLTALISQNSTSSDLQRATAEALAFLSYLKRFATKKEMKNDVRNRVFHQPPHR